MSTLLVAVIALLAGAAAPAPTGTGGHKASASQEIRFGIQVAQRGLWREARFRFERALALEPDNVKALNDLAVALEQEGEFDLARQAYERALALKPKDLSIQQNYELFQLADQKRKRREKAR